jgi:hypothetical protein
VAFSPDGKLLASTGYDGLIRLSDVATGREVSVLRGHTSGVLGVTFSPCGRFLATGGEDNSVRIWKVASAKENLTLRGHTNGIHRLAFSPDGRRLATASYDTTVKLWDTLTGQEVLTLRGHTMIVHTVAFSPDGQRLASGGDDMTVKIWEVTPLTPKLRLQRQAAALVNRLSAELGLKEAVIEQLQSDATLDEALRQQALAMADCFREDPWRLNQLGYFTLRHPGADTAKYRLALRQAEAALRLAPAEYGFSPIYHPWTQIGIAQYRLGQYREAVESLTRSESHYSATPALKTGTPWNLAFLAMSHHQLGENDKAQALLARLREILKEPRWVNNVDAQPFLREAEALLARPPASSKPDRGPAPTFSFPSRPVPG